MRRFLISLARVSADLEPRVIFADTAAAPPGPEELEGAVADLEPGLTDQFLVVLEVRRRALTFRKLLPAEWADVAAGRAPWTTR